VVDGNYVDVNSDQVTGKVGWKGLIEADGQGNLAFAASDSSPFEPAGSFQMEDDCTLEMSLELSSGESESVDVTWNFRGVLVNGGNAVIGIESDPGSVATLGLSKILLLETAANVKIGAALPRGTARCRGLSAVLHR
jgi:hypothetical protein